MTQKPSQSQERALAVSIALQGTDVERQALLSWATQLLHIRNSPASATQKAREALSLTAKSAVIWPIVKMMGREVKRLGWDDRGTKSRFAIIGAGVGAVVFGGQGAGIAALGTAIGVPLWVVLGAGGTFIGMIVEELQKQGATVDPPAKQPRDSDVIDV